MAALLSSRIKRQRQAMAKALTYQEWKEAALELDYLEGNIEWKEHYASSLYNYSLVFDRLTELKEARESKNHPRLIRLLREGLHHDLGNIGSPELYNRSYIGTKHLIEEYVNQVCDSLNYICDTELPELPLQDKAVYFKESALSFGRPALLLSGGATLGLFHLGVIKALWEKGLLPSVIAGSSVGSVIAALLATTSDAELPGMLDPGRHNLKAWKWLGLFSGLKGKGFMDIRQLERCLRQNIGEYTFQEAFEKSGRSVNISVSPVHHHQKARLLNRLTSPHIHMWSAAMASSAVPAIFPPVKLMKRDEEGRTVPFQPKLRWVDGSVVSDLPVDRLMHLFDVNFSIVSQTNPHIVPFLRAHRDKERGGLLAVPWKAMKAEIQFHGQALFDYLRGNIRQELLRQVAGQAYTVLAQRYYGDVTIYPRYRLWHYKKLLQNPSDEDVRRMTLEGERATWPLLSMMRSHMRISQTLEKVTERVEDKLNKKKPALKVVALREQ